MLNQALALSGVLLFQVASLAAAESAANTAMPRRSFGLGEVRHTAISPDLEFMATAGQAGAFLWDVQTATLRRRIDLPWSATTLAFSGDSKFLALASVASISTWDPGSGTLLQEFVGHQGEITRIRFSPDGQHLISASADNTVRVWSMATGDQLQSVRTPGSPIVDTALSPDGRELATVDTFRTNCVKIWDIATETQIGALPKTNWTAQRCLYTKGGQLLTTAADRTVTLWDPETETEIRSFSGVTNPTSIVLDLWLPNDSTVAAICSDGNVFLWNLETGALLKVVAGEPTIAANGVPHDFLTLTANLDYDIRIRQLPGGDTLRTFRGHTTSAHSAVAFSPDGRYILSGGSEAAVRLWDRNTGQPVREFMGTPAGTMAAAFSPDGSNVLTTIGLPNPGARVWNTETGEVVRDLKWTGGWPMAAVFSRDGSKIAARAQAQAVHIYNVASGALLRSLPNQAFASAIDFSPTAPLIAFASTDYTADLHNYETGQLLHTFFANAGPVTAVAFSPDGATLMIGWQDGVIHLYNTFTMELRRDFVTPAAFLEDAVFSPDGQYILTGEGWPSFTATLWDSQTTKLVRSFPGHKWSVSAVNFSRDGTSIVTGAEIVREWSVASIAARLRIDRLPNELRLAWSVGELQSAPSPDGPWLTVPAATSPFPVSTSQPAGFYRVIASVDD